MKTILRHAFLALALLAFSILNLQLSTAFAQGTAFTYQGQLTSNNQLVTGTYDLTFKLWTGSNSGAQIGSTLTDTGTGVTNGLFTVILDFGSQYNGTSYWLELGVRTNGAATFITLAPRQELTPTPYAITAQNVTGILPASSLSGVYNVAVTLSNASDAFGGIGTGLTALNATQLTSGTVSDARLNSDVALLDASQIYTGSPTFEGNTFVINSALLDTDLFTGLGFGFDEGIGEAGIMSCFAGAYGLLSFWTTPPGGAVTRQMMIDQYGDVSVDNGSANNGVLNNGTTNGAGLTFGFQSGEGIASKHSAGGNKNGLDFYTLYTNRMAITSNGFVGIGTNGPAAPLEVVSSQSGAGNNFNSPVSLIENTNTTSSSSPALRVLALGSPVYGALTASAQVSSGTVGNIATFGNADQFVAWLDIDGNFSTVGNITNSGLIISGSRTGTSQAPSPLGLVIRRINSTVTTSGSVIARSDVLLLERDGSNGGLLIAYPASAGAQTITAMGVNNTAGQVNFYDALPNEGTAGTVQIYTDSQNVVYAQISFGNTSGEGHLTQVTISRAYGNDSWVGTVTSTYNQ